MPILYCEPTYGLGNRLMMIASAIRLSKKWDYELVIVWKDHSMSCDYNAIFGEKFNYITESPSLPSYPTDLYPRVFINYDEIKGNDLYIKGFHFIFSLDDLNTPPAQITNELKHSWHEIVPSNEVLDKYLRNSFDLGIHVRRPVDIEVGVTSFETITNWTKPSDAFISNIAKNTIIKNNVRSIYICSPSQETINVIKDNLSDLNVNITISCSHNAWDLHNKLPLVEAYVDMLHLASCKHIIRHYLSTFSALPSLVSADTEVIYTDEDKAYERQPLVFSGAAL